MPDLPTCTVTFLFTDIEGSTALWEQDRDAMRQALVRHDALVEQIVTAHGGHVVRPRGEGDSRFAVFARATDAVTAAAALQQALYAEPWPTPTPLQVRMALHTGEADLRDGDYYGTAVNRCARLRAVAHGGQLLVSQATYDLVREHPLAGIELRDLGEHRLKDLQHSERIFQLSIDGVRADFPLLKTLDVLSHNLPLQPTSFIGREEEVATARQRLLDPAVRLLTLTGPGGTGKTRLALQVAAELLEDFADGVWLVELAPIHDPALVTSAIAAVLGVKESGAQPLIDSLKHYLRDKHLLLVLDNFEQVLAAAPLVAELLQAALTLKVLVTSRAPLHLRGEREVAVPPLALPLLTDLPGPQALEEVTAVRLFVERAQDVRADFVLTPANAAAVAEICVRLDGLPLAIELAAARSKMLAPQALLSRLNNRLKLLTGGAHDLPTRQQTLRGTIDWSFSLLDANEQRLFTRLGVFVGGWTVEAAEAVCNAEGDLGLDVLDGLQSLLDKSLLRQMEGADGEPRFRRLETIREYALERLAESLDEEALRTQHATYYLALAEEGARHRFGATEALWLDRLEQEHDNLRAALRWYTDSRDTEMGLRLAGALWTFWYVRGYVTEGRTHVTALLALPESAPMSAPRAEALLAAGQLARTQGDYAAARVSLEESLALYRALDDARGTAYALLWTGFVARLQEEYGAARALLEEGQALARVLGETYVTAATLHQLGMIVADVQADSAAARSLLEESLAFYRTLGLGRNIALVLLSLGDVTRAEGHCAVAHGLLRESLTTMAEVGEQLEIPWALETIAHLAMDEGQTERAVRLAGAAAGLRETMGTLAFPVVQRQREQWLASARTILDSEAFVVAWTAGQAMTRGQAVDYALEDATTAA